MTGRAIAAIKATTVATTMPAGPAIPDQPSPRPRAARPARQAVAGLRERIARIEQAHARSINQSVLPFGFSSIDAALDGGLRLGALHEATSAGPDTEHAAAAALFAAGILARLPGPLLWVLHQADLFAPGLAGAGLHPDRVVFAEAGKDVLAVAEEGLRHPGIAAVVAEPFGRLSLTASRRLQLAAEQSGVLAILIRRSRSFDDPALRQPTAAATRWRVAPLPSPPVLPHAPDVPGLGRARWRLELLRHRGGEPGSWIVEACDATGRLGVAADVADGSAPQARRHAGFREAGPGRFNSRGSNPGEADRAGPADQRGARRQRLRAGGG